MIALGGQSTGMTQNAEDLPQQPGRRNFVSLAVLTAATTGVAAIGWALLDQMNPAADVVARRGEVVLDYDVRRIPLGKQLVLVFRHAPLIIRHRTPDEIAAAVRGDSERLPFPHPDNLRTKPRHTEWLIVIGACTYDGCMTAINDDSEALGWHCVCCGSRYDTSGRARIGPAAWPNPAPQPGRSYGNLVVPPYEFIDDHTVRVT